jgi:quinoprotein glucose dehydrogenase
VTDAAQSLRDNLAGVFAGSDAVRSRAAQVATALGIREVIPVLRDLVVDKGQPPASRGDALAALVSLGYDGAERAAREALTEAAPELRAAARQALARLAAEDAIALLEQAVFRGELVERQSALAVLGNRADPHSAAVLATALDQLLAGEYPAGAALDLVEAVGRRNSAPLQEKLAAYEARRPQDDPLAPYLDCLEGGNAQRGMRLFFERSELSCVRCHKVGSTGGDVGPELTKIAADKRRDYLLEAIVAPSKTIARNFESVVVLDTDGVTHTGVLKQEDAHKLTLMTAEGKLVTIEQDAIEARKPGKSPMPEDVIKHLTKQELRDLVEFLSRLQ